jgi:hypothetical protein
MDDLIVHGGIVAASSKTSPFTRGVFVRLPLGSTPQPASSSR